MFFRREKQRPLTFDERLARLKQLGFSAQSDASGRTRVSKHGFAAVLGRTSDDRPRIEKIGVQVGDDVGVLENGGYQMFFITSAGRRIPALAEHLKALHNFQEDLREGLDMVSLYNTSLGTISDRHMYDRVTDRDTDRPKKAWEAQIREA